MQVAEMFFSVPVGDMESARAFYVEVFDASVKYASPVWSSLDIAGVRLGLNASREDTGLNTGLHFVVDDLASACDAVTRAGGVIVHDATEVQPGVIVADAADRDRNIFTLSLGSND